MLWYEGSNTALRASFVRLGFDRQGEVEACAARRVVGSPQAATMRFNDGAADPKSHAGPMRFRGKDRITSLRIRATISRMISFISTNSHCGVPFLNSRRVRLTISAARVASLTILDAASRASSTSG